MQIPECLKQLRDDLIAWGVINIDTKTPMSRKINKKDLNNDIYLTAEDVGAELKGCAERFKSETLITTLNDISTKTNQAYRDANIYTENKILEEASIRNESITTAKNQAISTAADYASTEANNAYKSAIEYISTKSSIYDNASNNTEMWSSKKIDNNFLDMVTTLTDIEIGAIYNEDNIGNLDNLHEDIENRTILVDAINETRDLGINVKSSVVNALVNSGLGITMDSTWNTICNKLQTSLKNINEYYAIKDGRIENCPNVSVEITGGWGANYGQDYYDGNFYYGVSGHSGGEEETVYWSVDTGNMNTNRCNYVEIGLYMNVWGNSGTTPKYTVWGDAKQIDSKNSDIKYQTLTYDVSSYSTFRIKARAYANEDDDQHVSVGFKYIRFYN
mgnify:CR=1 FL=1